MQRSRLREERTTEIDITSHVFPYALNSPESALGHPSVFICFYFTYNSNSKLEAGDCRERKMMSLELSVARQLKAMRNDR